MRKEVLVSFPILLSRVHILTIVFVVPFAQASCPWSLSSTFLRMLPRLYRYRSSCDGGVDLHEEL